MQILRNLLAPAIVLSTLLASTARSQNHQPFSFELRAGGSIPAGEFVDFASPGGNVGLTLLFAPDSTWAVYAGVQRAAFSSKYGGDISIRDVGVRAGARFDVPEARMGSTRTWLEAGVLLHRTSASSTNLRSNWKLGLEGGIGLATPLSPRVSFSPGVRYRRQNVGAVPLVGERKLHVSYFGLDLGINVQP